jgi:hypothetical protein
MALPASGPLSLDNIQTEFGGTNPIGINEYYAGGGLVAAGTLGTFGAVPSSGQISIQNFYGTSAAAFKYVEDMYASYAYLGTGGVQTVVNGVDVLNGYYFSNIFFKQRTAFSNSYLVGAPDSFYITGTTAVQTTIANAVTAFTTTGFTLGASSVTNGGGQYYISSTFSQTTTPKFSTLATWSGNNASSRLISHDLGSAPGLIIVKNNNVASNWSVWHKGNGVNSSFTGVELNSTVFAAAFYVGAGAMTDTTFEVGNIADSAGNFPNVTGNTYTAYLFASNAGGFGATGTDNIITCNVFSATAAGSVNLGYEPQWILLKQRNAAGDWRVFDSSRGFQVVSPRATGQNTYSLNGTGAEVNTFTGITPTSTGFDYAALTGVWAYIAVRKGPMKAPTSGTQVFSPIAANNATGTINTTGFSFDMQIQRRRTASGASVTDRLRTAPTLAATPSNNGQYLLTAATVTESAGTLTLARAWTSTSFQTPSNNTGVSSIYWNFKRAPKFFDIVCYQGDGVDGRTVNHNLTVAPEFLMVKSRNVANNWTGNYWPLGVNRYIYLNSANGASGLSGANRWASTAPTATDFTLGTNAETNGAGTNFVAYLFASCPGVSKLDAYTGTGSVITVNCGFTGGARFVMIKRTDIGSTTGSWYVWDTARGMVAGTNPSIQLNLSVAETNVNSVYTVATGFQIQASPTVDINTVDATYFYLAIA